MLVRRCGESVAPSRRRQWALPLPALLAVLIALTPYTVWSQDDDRPGADTTESPGTGASEEPESIGAVPAEDEPASEPFADSENVPDLPREDILEDFDAVWSTVEETYVDSEFDGVAWDEIREEYRTKIAEAEDTLAAYRLIAEMLDTLEGYNNFIVPPWLAPDDEAESADAGGVEYEYGGVGILLQELQSGEVMVLNVFRDTPAEGAGVLIGDKIVGVNDWRVAGDNPVQSIADRVRGPVGTPVTITLQDLDGAERDVEITRAQIDLRPSVEYELVDGRIGYLRIPVLSSDLVDEASKALPQLLSSSGLILDLRSVSSGTLDATIRIGQWFLGSAHMGGFLSREGAAALPFRSDAIAAYQRPIVVLTNWRTYGVGEILAFLLREYKRGKIVGNQTEGGFEVGQFTDLPSGGLLHSVIGRYVSPQGALLPLEGLTPDEAVDPPDLETIRSGEDVYIDKAVDVLRNSPRVL